MHAAKFLDTNILLYAYDLDAPAKRSIALGLVEAGWQDLGRTALSVQVLQEFHVNLLRRGLAQNDAARLVTDFMHWPVVDNSREILRAALAEQSRWQLSLWDALIVAAARASGATELLTEDLTHGQDLQGLRIVNPFR
jgi:predicted nucleic acid-binding protein